MKSAVTIIIMLSIVRLSLNTDELSETHFVKKQDCPRTVCHNLPFSWCMGISPSPKKHTKF